MLDKPLVQSKIKEVFGDFTPYLSSEGVPSANWEKKILTVITLPSSLPLAWNHKQIATTIRCHKLIAPNLYKALADAYSMPEVWATINDFGGCYMFRLKRSSTSKLSSHCWAIAIDLDVGDNPFSKTPQVHPKLVEIFKAHGFIWGGLFSGKSIDGMHFEFNDLGKLNA